MLEKNHCHASNPEEDLVMDLDEGEITTAYSFYAKEKFDSLEVTNNAILKLAWGKVSGDELKAVNIAGLETNDQEQLEAKEKKEREKQSSKRKWVDLQKICYQAQKAKKAKEASSAAGPSGSNPLTQPITPPPPPPNQLQNIQDNDQTPKGECILLLKGFVIDVYLIMSSTGGDMSPNSKLKAILDQSEVDTMKLMDDVAVLSDTDKVGAPPPPQVYHPPKLSNAPVSSLPGAKENVSAHPTSSGSAGSPTVSVAPARSS